MLHLKSQKKYGIALLFILLTKLLAAILIIQSGILGLGPDEAQYWTWSKSLDWGYYSKPPGIAWQIWVGTALFGDTELGIRFFSVILSFLLPLALYRLSKACRLSEATSFWAAVLIALSPLGLLSSVLATTDGGLVLFWTLSCIPVAKALASGKRPNYYLLGVLIAGGALFKWPMYIFWVLVFFVRRFSVQFRSRHLIGGILLSFLGLIPSFIWNAEHGWATFRHVFSTIVGNHVNAKGQSVVFKGNFFDFIGAQAVLISPVLFALLLISLFFLVKKRKTISPPLIFCGGTTLVLLVFYSFLSIFQKMQGNWCVFAYPSGFVFLAWHCTKEFRGRKIWMKSGVFVSLLLTFLVFSVPYFQKKGALPYKINPFKHNLGWQQLERTLQEVGYNPEKEFLFSDKYQEVSVLSFYAPHQKRAYFFNLRTSRKNQFSYWSKMRQDQLGKTGYFVITENQPRLSEFLEQEITQCQSELENYFSEVKYLGTYPLFYHGSKVGKGAIIFKCLNYSGKEPKESFLF